MRVLQLLVRWSLLTQDVWPLIMYNGRYINCSYPTLPIKHSWDGLASPDHTWKCSHTQDTHTGEQTLSTHRPRENHTAQGVWGSASSQVTFQLKSDKSLPTRWVTASMDSSFTTKGPHCNNERAPYNILQWMLVVIKCRDVLVAEGGEDTRGVMR